jgi:dissimilatory sulfite reductase (desulfoviridin) alpha/beta subunit
MARRAVEKLALREGLDEITADAVRRATPRRGAPKGQALADLVHEAEEAAAEAAVTGKATEITVCGGLAGCPLAVGDTKAAFDGLKGVARALDLEVALSARIDGPVLSHSRCKMTVCACPNGCSEPQIKDVALLARAWPEEHLQACTKCMACVKACPDRCITVDEEGAHVDFAVCIGCGRCITACRDEALTERSAGWDVLVAGRLGRHPRFATALNDDPLPLAGALVLASRALAFLVEHGEPEERIAAVLEREGEDALGRYLR